MNLASCPPEPELLPLTTGESADDVSAHVAGCPDCQARLERLFAEVQAVRDASGLHSSRTGGPMRSESATISDIRTSADLDSDLPQTVAGYPVPARTGKYFVVGKIDEGGQAVVYRVVNPGLTTELAPKLSKTTIGMDETAGDVGTTASWTTRGSCASSTPTSTRDGPTL